MKKNKAFSLAEVMIAFMVIIVILAVVSPVIKNKMINSDRNKLKHSYAQLLSIIEALSWDTTMFPDSSGFANMSAAMDPRTGEVYSGANKFTQLFMNKLNIINENVTLPNENAGEIDVPSACTDIYSRENCTSYNTVCFTNSAKVTYCLDQAASKLFRDGYVIIVRLFLGDSLAVKDGYYFAVSPDGKVDVLPTKVTFAKRNNGNDVENAGDFCAVGENYLQYKHCKTNDLLRKLHD